ncbi:hypothetical protein L6164_003266 [Bauhinia variegata]|uniref:Uncharacterized protein n=1 Tax=Bauhinia variegata TaxID=167791 RepID=A0ACB9Q0T6_BAUVA|nr:hypothetical protein L6164_003266 [Bauhinia variegata]
MVDYQQRNEKRVQDDFCFCFIVSLVHPEPLESFDSQKEALFFREFHSSISEFGGLSFGIKVQGGFDFEENVGGGRHGDWRRRIIPYPASRQSKTALKRKKGCSATAPFSHLREVARERNKKSEGQSYPLLLLPSLSQVILFSPV